ncbi:MAG: response regulator transcription factor [Haliea sp.]|nr:MAG: response regulator transcription factor [Haliea sp.]
MPDEPDAHATRQPRAMIQVALVDDDVEVQNAIAAAIGTASDITLVSMANTHAAGLQLLEGPAADVLLVDLGLPGGSGIDVIRRASERWPRCAVMVCTTFADEMHVLQSIEAGASGYLLKDGGAGDMLAEIRSLHGGGSPISPLIARQILMRFRPAPVAREAAPGRAANAGGEQAALSAREQEVLELITKGFTADEIAQLMQVSTHTVQTFVRRIYGKLKVTSRAEAIYEARSQGLLRD